MIALILAAQLTPAMPVEMRPAVEPYSQCVSDAFHERFEQVPASGTSQYQAGSAIMTEAIASCAQVRATAAVLSGRALERSAGLEDPATRQAFVLERLTWLDDLFRWSVTPEADPDNWNLDAENR